MTITSTTTKVIHNGNGATTVFPWSFLIPAQADLQVILTSAAGVETVQTVTTHYTVTGLGDDNGGSVTMLTAPVTGEKLTIRRLTAQTQETDLTTGAAFYAEDHEAVFDKLTMMIQEVQEQLDRAVKVDLSSGEDPDDLIDQLDADVASASASASAAATSATNASTSATNAANSSTAAAASAAAAALSAASGLFNTVLNKASADSPYTVVAADDGAMVIATMDGNVALTLPSIGAVGEGFRLGVLRSGASNALTLTPNGSDTINGLASKTLDTDGDLAVLVADAATPDNWVLTVWTQATAGTGLTKSGSVISLDINGLTAETSVADADLIPFYDASAAAHRKMTRANLIAGLNTTDDEARYQALLNALVERRKSGTQGGTGLVKGHVDAYLSDTIGSASTDETYDATGDYYHNRAADVLIDRTLGTNIGDMTIGGGLASAFDGVEAQTRAASATGAAAGDGKLGKDYGVGNGYAYAKFEFVSSSDYGFAYSTGTPVISVYGTTDGGTTGGTLLGSVGPFSDPAGTDTKTVTSTDTTTVYRGWYAVVSGMAGGQQAVIAEAKAYTPGTPPNMTLTRGSAVVATATPTTAWVVALVDPVSAVTYNTDYTVEVSSNGGTNWDAVTLTNVGSYDGVYDILVGKVTLTGNSTSMNYRKAVANNKELRDAGIAYMWA